MTRLASVDFKKGCFIGQEVVSRMQHRGTARKRTMRVQVEGETTATRHAQPVTAGAATIGTLGSVR